MSRERKVINIQIGKRLKEVRENSENTQGKFGEVLNVGVEHYRKIESGLHE